MINIENEVFSLVSTRVREKYPDIYMTGEYVRSPSSFPHASLVEMDNTTYTSTQTGCGDENHASVMYEVDVYSNKTKVKVLKKTETTTKKIKSLMNSRKVYITNSPVTVPSKTMLRRDRETRYQSR